MKAVKVVVVMGGEEDSFLLKTTILGTIKILMTVIMCKESILLCRMSSKVLYIAAKEAAFRFLVL